MGLDTPPLPIAATLSIATGAWTVTFNQPLQPGPLAAGNWSFIASAFTRVAVAPIAAGSAVTGGSTAVLPSPDPDAVDYDAVPADVLGLLGLPAAAFTDFPLLVT